MRYLVSGSQMKEIDRYTIEEIGIPSMVLMERAAMAVAAEAHQAAGPGGPVIAAAGLGNNGADAVAAARMLKEMGHPVSLILAGDPDRGTEELKMQLKIAGSLGIHPEHFRDFIPGPCRVLIDGVFGVGLNRPVEGNYKDFLHFLSTVRSQTVIAVDLPSGISADTGAVMGPAVKADITVTFGCEKIGTAVYPGKSFCGRLVIADAGFPKAAVAAAAPAAFTYGKEDICMLPSRPARSHKGTFGKVLVAGGRKHMAGAAFLAARAAYRMGAGLVQILSTEENREIFQTLLPEAVMIPWEEAGPETEALERLCREASAVVLGPGLGRDEQAASLVKAVLSTACSPVVLDADGLYALSVYQELTGYFTENIVITPHMLEMARLAHVSLEAIQADPVKAAAAYADQYGITCVLKDAATVVAGRSGSLYINSSGCPAMAKGGSGDVLAGVIGGLLAQGMEDEQAAALGVFLHGMAGEAAASALGDRAVLARDLADFLGVFPNDIEKEVSHNE